VNAINALVLGQDSGGSIFSLLLPLLLLGPLIYFMVVPQRKERQRHAAFLDKVEIGDGVVTSGGLHGTITFIEDDVVHLEIDSDVVMRVSKASLARFEVEADEVDEADDEPEPDEK
jgi:preprotein translocase subunit YajC